MEKEEYNLNDDGPATTAKDRFKMIFHFIQKLKHHEEMNAQPISI